LFQSKFREDCEVVRHSMVRGGAPQHGTRWCATAWCEVVRHSMVRGGAPQHGGSSVSAPSKHAA